jgi:hypothetical protein
MTGENCKMLTKKDKNVATAEAVRTEARDKIRLIAMPILPGENIKAQWRKVSRKTGLNSRRVRSLWYGQANTIHGHELDTIRNFASAEKTVGNVVEVSAEIIKEITDIRERLDRLMAMLGEAENGR